MKIQLLAFLLGFSVVMHGMNSNEDKFLCVSVGGHVVNNNEKESKSRYVCNRIMSCGNEWLCSVVMDSDDQLFEVVKNKFFAQFRQSLVKEKSVRESLEDAYTQCKLTVDELELQKPLSLVASCFDIDSQKMNILSVGGTCTVFGGVKCCHAASNKDLDPVFFEHHYDDDFGYSIGGSSGFWNEVEGEDVSGLLFDARTMSQEKFYSTHAPLVKKSVKPDDIGDGGDLSAQALAESDEDENAIEIAKRLADVALSRNKNGDIAVMVTLLGSTGWPSGLSSDTYDADSSECTSSSDSANEDLRKQAQDLTLEPSSPSAKACADTSSSSSYSTELESFEFPKVDTEEKIDKETISDTSTVFWKSFIQNHKYKIGGCVAVMLAMMVAAYKYNYFTINYSMI